MPLQEAKMSTNIRFKFRTHQENAFVFLAAGRTDYCLLQIHAGRINFSYKVEQSAVEIWSPRKVKLNDNQWHDIAIHRYDNNITMQVDNHFMGKSLTGNSTEFNVHFGIFLGGVGDFSESYLNSVINFRGCLSDVFYNNINVLKRAKEGTGHAASYGVSWTCSSEFDAKVTDSISFLGDQSLTKFTRPSTIPEETLSFDIRTIDSSGSVFYNIGQDFILIEISNEKLHLIVTKGKKYVIELTSEMNISDGKWHNVFFKYNATTIEISVDNLAKGSTFPDDNYIKTDLSLDYYFGGQSDEIKKKISAWDFNGEMVSFKGCLKEILFNGEMIGLPQMEETHDINADCVWKYPCMERLPCISTSVCRQHSFDEFICYCDQAFCIKADYTLPYKIFDPFSETEIVQISTIHLLEGGTVFLTTDAIKILIDLAELKISDLSILFHVIQPPKFGQLYVFSSKDVTANSTTCKSFSLKELNTDKVKYVHNGNENFNDHITMDLQIIGAGHSIPRFLQGKHRFVLHLNVTPVNDAPVLRISDDKILRVIQGIPKIVKDNLLKVIDPDSPPDALIYSVLTPLDPSGIHGRFEINNTQVTKFSQQDVNQGFVSYIFDVMNVFEDTFFDLEFQVSDGIETSKTETLSISVHPLQLKVINNTGLILVHKSSALITPSNLYTVTNSDEDSIDIRYDIIQQPKYGFIQKLRTVDSSWIAVESFTNSQLVLGHIRYFHSIDVPSQDEFKFTASFGKVVTQKYDFRITFTKLKIRTQNLQTIYINGSKETIITDQYLLHQTIPQPTFARNIIYTILKPTKYGLIIVDGHPKAAKEMDSFTQLDIEKNLIRYKTFHTSYSEFLDELQFIVSVLECDDIYGKLEINFRPDERFDSRLIRHRKENIKVKEGDRQSLSRAVFEIYFDSFRNLTFVISTPPRHGTLCQYDQKSREYLSIGTFSLEDLENTNYCHDDSESESDSFELLALSEEAEDFQYVCNISVTISLVNDNPPVRHVERILHVVRNATRTITSDILAFTDVDIDTHPSSIKYKHISCSNGKFYKSGKLVDNFSQMDIDNNLIVFHHSFFDTGAASFIVTDGFYEVPGLLEIEASDPFLSLPQSNASIVQEGGTVTIETVHLGLETNLNAKPAEIHYKVTRSPNYGVMFLLSSDSRSTGLSMTPTTTFTKEDVLNGRLIYQNKESASMDQMRYRVSINNVTADGEILIRIYPAAYWEPLQIKRNETLYVEESTSVLITKDILEVIHPNISPGDITYLVTSSPLHGYLEMQSMNSDDDFNCKVFDQSAINAEKLSYIHAGVNQSSDFFIFDVTNGITWLKNLILKIIVIPERLYIVTRQVTVVEGKSVTFHPDDIQPASEYYRSKILEYKINEQPSFGYVTSGKSKINRFTQKQLESGFVQYIHDGSENSADSLKLTAIARNKESVPFELKIIVAPVNDEMPFVVTNTGLQVWNGGKYIIKNTDIMVQDYDSPPETIKFTILHVYGGYLAYTRNMHLKIDEFTQQDINNDYVIFVHDPNSKINEFNFIASDGLFNTTEQKVYISVKPVTLSKINNELLHVFPLSKRQILTDHLLYSCSDEKRLPKYRVTVPLQLGRLLLESKGEIIEVSEFDQDDINNGRLYYEHITAMQELRTNDSFLFDVAIEPVSRLVDQKFIIEVSVSSGGLLRFISFNRLVIEEGGSAPINLDFSKILEYLKVRAGIVSPELFIETYKPAHGTIEILSEKAETEKLTPTDFMAGFVHYVHDHSDTLEDEVFMSIFLSQGNIFLCNVSIPISIDPINDQPFNLVTSSPHMSVVEGENKTITRDNLLTEDADSSPEEIVYEIISGPTNGFIVKADHLGNTLDILAYGNRFTQADIDKNLITFIHQGSSQSTTFYFKVWDGTFKPVYEIFNITVVQVMIMAKNTQNPVRIQQGENISYLDPKNILIETNAQKNRLMYNITNSPLSGFVLLQQQPTLRFSYQQLDKGEITYMQTDLSKSNDTFQIVVYINGTNYGTSVDVKVLVEPFIKIEPVSIRIGERARLTSSFASDNPGLLKFSKYNPRFAIIHSPKIGEIKKILRNTGSGTDPEGMTISSRVVSSFTYKELKSGMIYFEMGKEQAIKSMKSDSFDYILSMKSVQPGQRTVPVEIVDNSLDDLDTVHVIQSSPYSIAYLAGFCALLIIILFILILLIFIGCRRYRLKKDTKDNDYPPPLPQLPEFTSLDNQRYYSPSDVDSVTAPSTPLPGISNIPHCKVIPIGALDMDLMDFDPGPDDEPMDDITKNTYHHHGDNDDWSDIANDLECSVMGSQQHQLSNPLLRRNQYWV